MEHYEKGPKFHEGRRVIFVSGDDRAAKATVSGLVKEFGFLPVVPRRSGGRRSPAASRRPDRWSRLDLGSVRRLKNPAASAAAVRRGAMTGPRGSVGPSRQSATACELVALYEEHLWVDVSAGRTTSTRKGHASERVQRRRWTEVAPEI